MPILFLGFSAFVLASPLYTQNLFREAYVWERMQIDLDNAGIRLGRNQRAGLREFESALRSLKSTDTGHDIVHKCARLPGPQKIKCAIADRLFEQRMLIWKEKIRFRLLTDWRRAELDFKNELSEKSLVPALYRRRGNIPIKDKKCDRCHLPVFLEIEGAPASLTTAVRLFPAKKFPVENSVLLTRNLNWNFRLAPRFEFAGGKN